MNPHTAPDAHPYLRAATAGLRHHARTLTAADRIHLDALHAHLTELGKQLDQLADTTRAQHPAAGRRLAAAYTRLWQANAEAHAAFHLLPVNTSDATTCRPEQLPEGPPFLTICQRHLRATHAVRRKTTPTDLDRPPHTACAR